MAHSVAQDFPVGHGGHLSQGALVVLPPERRVAEHLVGLRDGLKPVQRRGVVGVLVWMKFLKKQKHITFAGSLDLKLSPPHF